jgi:CHAD domain-containing protein
MSASPTPLLQTPVGLPWGVDGRNLPGPKNGPSQSWEWAKLRKIALRQMDKFIDLFPLVLRNEDLTAVNLMRITCRRLEQILELVYAKPRPGHIRKLRRRLKRCRRTLGELRDCDALLAVADRSITAKALDTDAWRILRDYLITLRQRKAQLTLTRLGRVNLAIPYLRVKRDFDFPGKDSAIAKRGATQSLYRRVLRSLDSRWSEFAAAVEKSHSDPCEHVIHQMRIAAKRLRYLAEVMEKLHISGSKETLGWLKSLQRTVGVWHDLEIMEKLLRNVLAHRKYFHVKRLAEVQMQHLIRHNRKTKKESAAQFFRMTRRSPEYQHMKKWVSGLLETGIHRPVALEEHATRITAKA